ncbi:hypothetical protein GCM10009651_32760 [Microbacterium natoriense]|uniref:MarR family winged helix-turn-helix transcriptional regulator n=1 Tax=Microbacterium natoriense TaxID=284570 RepID=UPI0031DE6176
MELEELDLPTLASIAGGGVGRAVIERMQESGFTGVKPSHGYVIQRLLADEPTITELAAALGMTQQGASKQVRDLAELGYVERLAVPGDQRSRRVRLTDSGRAMIDSARAARTEIEADVLARVGAENVAASKVALAALLDVVGLNDRVRTRTVPEPAA